MSLSWNVRFITSKEYKSPKTLVEQTSGGGQELSNSELFENTSLAKYMGDNQLNRVHLN